MINILTIYEVHFSTFYAYKISPNVKVIFIIFMQNMHNSYHFFQSSIKFYEILQKTLTLDSKMEN